MPLVLCVLFSSCTDVDARSRVIHPAADRLRDPGTANAVLDIQKPGAHGDSIAAVRLPFANAAVVQLGVLDSPEVEAFGRVDDVTVTADGRLIILDALARQLLVFDQRGVFLQRIGGPGFGPSEFSRPQAIHASGARLAVFDGDGRVSLFDVDDDSVRYSHVFFAGANVFDGCIMNGRLYVHGSRVGEAHAISVFTLDGTPSGSFAEIYRTENRLIQMQLSSGHIACNEESELILMASSSLPELHAYDRHGQMAWWIRLDGFTSIEAIAIDRGGSRLRIPESGMHSTVGLASSRNTAEAVLQIAWNSNPRHGAASTYQLRTFVISVIDTYGIYVGEQLGRVFDWSSEHVVLGEAEPFPTVQVLRHERMGIGSE